MCTAVIGYSELGTETKVEPFGLSHWSQRKTSSKSEITQCQFVRPPSRLLLQCVPHSSVSVVVN